MGARHGDSDRTTARKFDALDEPTLVDEPALDDPLATLASGPKERYHLRSILGRGGMGEVQLCKDERIGRDVALKKVRPELVDSRESVSRFIREARIQGQLEHPAIVPVHDMGVGPDGVAYFTMKRIRGVTLEEVIYRLADGDEETARRFTRRRLLSAFVTVCLAVDFAHSRGVLHRDLKPNNIMLGSFGEVYVLDWGLAKAQAEPSEDDMADEPTSKEGREPVRAAAVRTQPGQVFGTPGFMSPEQFTGRPLDGRSDVYALGAILFEILALSPMHQATGYVGLADSTLRGTEARPSRRAPDRGVTPDLDEICVRATMLDPAQRTATARELSEQVDAYLEGDRDLAARAALAEKHAVAARAALEAPPRSAAEEAATRRVALLEATAALSLDPRLESARESLVQALTEPFAHPPKEAIAAFKLEESERAREIAKAGVWAWVAMLAYLPILAWMGVRSVAPMLILFAVLLGNVAAYHWLVSRPRLRERHVLVVLGTNALAIAGLSLATGPFLLVPAAATIAVVPFLLFVRRARAAVVAMAAGSVAVAFALERAGLLPVTYAFDGGALVIRSSAVAFPALPTSVLLLFAGVATVLTAALVVTRVKDRLVRVEQQLYVYGWQLSQLLPPRVGARTTRRTLGGP